MAENDIQTPVDAPMGMFNGRLDEKGRLKLPVPFQTFLSSFTEKRLFVTSLDRNTALIYPISVWRSNDKLLKDYVTDPDVANNVAFNAQDLGADAEMDNQGRVLFNPELRRALDMENHPLRLYAYKGHIKVLTEAVYQSQRQVASTNPVNNVRAMERAGLQ